MTVQDSDYFAHYGVKGMKWGVRHDKPSSGIRKKASATISKAKAERNRRKKAEFARRSPERKSVDTIRASKKKAKYMTDAELKTAINRLNLESQYNRLSMEIYSPGKKFVRDFMLRSGNKSVDTVFKEYVQNRFKRNG